MCNKCGASYTMVPIYYGQRPLFDYFEEFTSILSDSSLQKKRGEEGYDL